MDTIAAFIRGLFRAPLTSGDSSNTGRLEGQALSRYSKHFVGALRAWTAQVRRRVAFLTRKWTPLPRYVSTVFRHVDYSVTILLLRTLEEVLVLDYPVGWATRAQPVDAQTRASILASINQDAGDRTLLIMACRHGYVKVVEDILQLIPQHIPASILEASSMGGLTALHYAVMEGHDEVVNLLLRAGAHASCESELGTTPLMIASKGGRVDLVRRLLAHLEVSELEKCCADGRTALYYAADGGHEKIIDLLLSHGAQVNNMDLTTMTPLMYASWRGHLGVVQKLLQVVGEEGLLEKDEDEWTALHHAAAGGHADVVAFLLSHGAQAISKDMGGTPPLVIASAKGHHAVVQILLQHMRGQGLDDRDMGTGVALHLACFEDIAGDVVKPDDGRAEGTVRALLLAGADASATDAEGATPRTLAEMRGHSELVAVFDWWEAELERPYLLYRAKRLRDIHRKHPEAIGASVPAYLETRGAVGLAVPVVEVEDPQQRWYSVSRKTRAEAVEEERHEMLVHVLENLNEQLFIELMDGFHGPRGGEREE